MFARIMHFDLKVDKKDEFIKIVKNEVLPILKKQVGFVEILPFTEEAKPEKVIAVTLWNTKRDVERYVMETAPKVKEIVYPYLTTPVEAKAYVLETTIAKHFVEALTA